MKYFTLTCACSLISRVLIISNAFSVSLKWGLVIRVIKTGVVARVVEIFKDTTGLCYICIFKIPSWLLSEIAQYHWKVI